MKHKKMEYVINFLERHLQQLEHDLQRSIEDMEEGCISRELNQIHLSNLNPKIKVLKKAIIILKNEL